MNRLPEKCFPDGHKKTFSIICNPEYRTLSYKIKKCKEKKSRLEAKAFKKIGTNGEATIEDTLTGIAKNTDLLDQIDQYNQEIEGLLGQRAQVPARVSVSEMSKDAMYNKLKLESKKLKNAILMLAYRAETALYNVMEDMYANTKKDGRVMLKEIFTSDADLIPDYKNKTLNVFLHSMSTPRGNKLVRELCKLLNQTETRYPGTEMILNYKSVAD